MRYKFEDLIVWQLSLKVIKLAYQLTKKFLDDERFGLTSQLRRAAVSINLNIAEGSGRKTKKDFSSFLRNALGSVREVIACLKISEEVLQELFFKLVALEKSLQ